MAKKYRNSLIGVVLAIASTLAAFYSDLLSTTPPRAGGNQIEKTSTAIGPGAVASQDGAAAGGGAVAIAKIGPGASSNVSVTNSTTHNFSIFTQNTCEKMVGWERCVFPVVDKNGVPAKLITVISKDLAWKKGSEEKFEDQSGEANFVQHIRSNGIEFLIKQFSTIVTVGAASHEITSNVDPIKFENNRAYKRATHLQRLIKENGNCPVDRLYLLTDHMCL